MKITKEQLNEIIAAHGRWLRDEEDGKRANLQEADLQGANLQGANLQEADLQGANLQEADLRGANLQGANLQGANLQGANLQEADLQEADLRGADLDKTYYQVVRIGSRNATTTYCVDDDNVICGCWNQYRGGTLAEFKERVESVYGDSGKSPNKKYYAQYMAAIKFFAKMAELAKEDRDDEAGTL